MTPVNILVACAVLLTTGLLTLMWLLMPVLLDLRRAMASAAKLTATLEEEITPTLRTVNRLTKDVENKVRSTTQFLDALSLAMGGVDEAKKRMLPYLLPSRIWALSVIAGIKKGIEVMFSQKS